MRKEKLKKVIPPKWKIKNVFEVGYGIGIIAEYKDKIGIFQWDGVSKMFNSLDEFKKLTIN